VNVSKSDAAMGCNTEDKHFIFHLIVVSENNGAKCLFKIFPKNTDQQSPSCGWRHTPYTTARTTL